MKYNFDEIIERGNTLSKKWNPDFYKGMFNNKTDLLPLWVADMDFKVAKPILDSLQAVINHGILGYTSPDEKCFEAIIHWNKKRKNVYVKKEWIVFTSGVVPAINFMVQTFTKEGDCILIQTPVYNPFRLATENNKRKVVENPLINSNGYYEIDFQDFEQKIIDNNVKMFILCNPHNPVGRVWNKEELEKMAEICLKHNVLIIADEIHSDLIYKEHKFHSFLSLNEKYQKNVLVCTALSKTFNIAGVQTSIIIIPDEKLRESYRTTLANVRLENPNSFGIETIKSGYFHGEEWLEELIQYLDKNRKFIAQYLKENIPEAKYRLPEGTYLAWIDLKDVLPANETMEDFFENKAKVAIDYGTWFGKEGDGFIRLNFACPTSILKKALDRIKNAL
ncbi:MalY/PatB family protein [Fusobacterium sp.]|uniref:MalY/PatB family protein n=1 Tax=Fusobacterium sp. TaxID=68766 RepID=UPI00396C5EBA